MARLTIEGNRIAFKKKYECIAAPVEGRHSSRRAFGHLTSDKLMVPRRIGWPRHDLDRSNHGSPVRPKAR
jgi:hypothetical protein